MAGEEGEGLEHLRASDGEREQVVERLSLACAEGRLTLEELGARIEAAYSARARGELGPLLADLPEPAAGPARPAPEKKREPSSWIVSVMGETTRRGHWRLPSRAKVVTVMGETLLDLGQAVIEGNEIEISIFLLMGKQEVIVPEGVEVEVTGLVVMGSRRLEVKPVQPRPGVPRLRLRVGGLMGELNVRTG
jgi:hypothetical protein